MDFIKIGLQVQYCVAIIAHSLYIIVYKYSKKNKISQRKHYPIFYKIWELHELAEICKHFCSHVRLCYVITKLWFVLAISVSFSLTVCNFAIIEQ